MKPPKLSVIIPTIGRHELAATVASVREQRDANNELYDPNDIEIIIVGDVHGNKFQESLRKAPLIACTYGARYLEWDGGQNCFGHPQRNYGQSIARGYWLTWLQDDDVYAPGAFQEIFKVIRTPDNKNGHWGPVLCRTQTWQAGIVWREPKLYEGNIDANCIVAPNIPDRLAQWGMKYTGDFEFIRDTCALWENDILWHEGLIAVGRPNMPAGVGVL